VPCLRTECVRHHSYLLHFGKLPYTQIWGQVLSSTVPANRMCQALLQVFHFGMLAYTKMRAQVLSSTVPAHRMCQTLLIVLTFMDAALHTDKGSSALKYRACAQNVSDTTHICHILESCPTPRYGDKCSQVTCLRTECLRRYYSFFFLGCWPTPR
jgi:hypothetical protein